MIKPFVLIICLLPITLLAQKIKSNGYDKTLHQKVIETYALSVKEAPSAVMTVKLKSVGPALFAYIGGFGMGLSVINPNDTALFILDNDSTVAITATSRQGYNWQHEKRPVYQHKYVISRNGVEALSQHKLKAIRKYSGTDYTYINVPAKYQNRVRRLSTLFLKFLPKAKANNVASPQPAVVANSKVTETASPVFTNIKLEEAAEHIGDSVMVCGKVFSARYLQRSNNKPTLINLGAAYPNQLLTVVIYEEDRANFGPAPEEAFFGKEICVTGTIQLFNEKPQIVVHQKAQISVRE